MRRLLLAALVALPAAAEPPVEIRTELRAGAKTTRTTDVEGRGTMSVESGGTKKEFETAMTTGETAAEEVLEAAGGRAQKVKRLYRRKLSTFQVPALERDERNDSSLTGHAVTVALKDGKPSATCPDANVNPKDLARESLNDEWDLPIESGRAVGPGDTWEPDPKLVQAWSEGRGRKLDKAALKCTLREFVEACGERCARIEVELDASGKTPADRGPAQALAWTLKGSVWFGTVSRRIVKFELEGALRLAWETKPAGKPAESWANDMTLKLTGSSTPGTADFSPEGK